MKNSLQVLIALFTLSLFLTSCSQTREVVDNDDPSYRYRKVYVGNKIVYRDKKEEPQKDAQVKEVEKQQNEEADPLISDQELPVTASAEKTEPDTEKKESFTREASRTFTNNLNEVHTSISSGGFLSSLFQKRPEEKIRVSKAAEDDDKTMIGTYEIFALLGFVFGLTSLFGGIILAILGLVFSILGLNSGYRIFAVLGLIFSIVGFILALV